MASSRRVFNRYVSAYTYNDPAESANKSTLIATFGNTLCNPKLLLFVVCFSFGIIVAIHVTSGIGGQYIPFSPLPTLPPQPLQSTPITRKQRLPYNIRKGASIELNESHSSIFLSGESNRWEEALVEAKSRGTL